MKIIVSILKTIGCMLLGLLRFMAIALFSVLIILPVFLTLLASFGGYDDPHDKLMDWTSSVWEFLFGF